MITKERKNYIMKDFYILTNGVKIPSIGLGTWQSKEGSEAYNAVLWALKNGYRHIDTAYVYDNEASVGKAIIDSKINREEIFITSKLPANIKDYDKALEYFDKTIKNLNVTYLDLYLIHAPWPWENVGQDCTEGNIAVWKAMIKLYKEKKIRAIGVSNFSISDIEKIVTATNFKPMVNQIRYFIGNTQKELTEYCMKNDILVEAYSPFATGEILNNEILNRIAEKYHTSIAKICMAFCLQNHTLPLPKSIHEQRIIDNFNIDITLSPEDMDYLNKIDPIGTIKALRS